MRMPPFENKMYRYIRELDETVAALDAALDQAEALTAQIHDEFPSMQMQVFAAKKDQLMPDCRRMSEMLALLRDEMERAQRAYEAIDTDIAKQFTP